MKKRLFPTNRWLVRALLLLSIYSVFTSCSPEEESVSQPKIEGNNNPEEGLSLGKKLNNPYSVENMTKAYNNLATKRSNLRMSEVTELPTTHYYVKFIPKNEMDLSLLKRDTTLVLFPYPLDYEIKGKGSYFHDPSVPTGTPTYQYAAVKSGYNFPAVSYQIISNLYLPDADTTLSAARQDLSNALEEEALRITGNLEEPLSNQRTSASRWTPRGRITFLDDQLGVIGLEGVVVRATRWFTTHTGHTDINGNYVCGGSFKGEARYSIIWDRKHFSVRTGTFGQATYNGPKKKGNWDHYVWGGSERFYAQIYRAAHHYYYKDILGLRRPPMNTNVLDPQLKIAAYNYANADANGAHSDESRIFGILAQIDIYNPQQQSEDIYGTVIHELAHASHWNMNRSDFDPSDKIVKESWPRGVQYVLGRMVYPAYQGGPVNLPNYTNVIVDLIDTSSDDFSNHGTERPNDLVTGYTIRQIEDALHGQRTWTGWRNNIKNLYANATENNVDTLFAWWD